MATSQIESKIQTAAHNEREKGFSQPTWEDSRQGLPRRSFIYDHREKQKITPVAGLGIPRFNSIANPKPIPGPILLSEDQQFECLQQLGPVIRSLPGFKDSEWNSYTRILEVLAYHFRELEAKTKNREISFRLVQHENGNWIIQTCEPVYFKFDFYGVSMCWLFWLEKINKDLFDLVFFMLVYMSKEQYIGLWSECCEGGWEYEQFRDYYLADNCANEKEDALARQIIRYYSTKGLPYKMLRRIRRAGFNKKIWLSALKKFKPAGKIEKKICDWLIMGSYLMGGGNFRNHIFHKDEFLGGDSNGEILPDQLCGFVWTIDDMLGEHICSQTQEWALGTGAEPFYSVQTFGKGSTMADGITTDPFPEMILEFMEEGAKVYEAIKGKNLLINIL